MLLPSTKMLIVGYVETCTRSPYLARTTSTLIIRKYLHVLVIWESPFPPAFVNAAEVWDPTVQKSNVINQSMKPLPV
jgi:hypothetical protein